MKPAMSLQSCCDKGNSWALGGNRMSEGTKGSQVNRNASPQRLVQRGQGICRTRTEPSVRFGNELSDLLSGQVWSVRCNATQRRWSSKRHWFLSEPDSSTITLHRFPCPSALLPHVWFQRLSSRSSRSLTPYRQEACVLRVLRTSILQLSHTTVGTSSPWIDHPPLFLCPRFPQRHPPLILSNASSIPL